MPREKLELAGPDLPPKINMRSLQAALDVAAGRPIGLQRFYDAHTDKTDGLMIEFDPDEGPVDVEALLVVVRSHAPAESDREERTRERAEHAAKQQKLERLLDKVDDLERVLGRVEALENGGLRQR